MTMFGRILSGRMLRWYYRPYTHVLGYRPHLGLVSRPSWGQNYLRMRPLWTTAVAFKLKKESLLELWYESQEGLANQMELCQSL